MTESNQKQGGCQGCISRVFLAFIILIGLGFGWAYLQRSLNNARDNRVRQQNAQQLETNKAQLLDENNCSDCDLTGVDLSGADLSGANLTGANLSNTNLSGANLTGADLTGVTFANTQVGGANLTDAKIDNLTAALGTIQADDQTLLPNGAFFVAPARLATVCTDQKGLPEAAAYPGDGSIHPIEAFRKENSEATFSLQRQYIPSEVISPNASSTELVLCVDESATELLQTCEYTVGVSNEPFKVERYRRVVRLSLVEAQTGQVVDSTTESIDPSECQPDVSLTESEYAEGTRTRYGQELDAAVATDWVQPYVMP